MNALKQGVDFVQPSRLIRGGMAKKTHQKSETLPSVGSMLLCYDCFPDSHEQILHKVIVPIAERCY